jgi:UPF0042 nucleotide-binding protein
VDARFIPNPHWKEELRAKTGNDTEVSDYVLAQPGVAEFVSNYVAALRPVINGYRNENKRFATLAIGCTGGKHRSVALANRISELLADEIDVRVSVKHRDLGRE